jgi:hypothetical protein
MWDLLLVWLVRRSERWTGRTLSRAVAAYVLLTGAATLVFAVILLVLLLRD